MTRRIACALAGLLIVTVSVAQACSLCTGSSLNRATLREDAGLARMVLYGALANSRIGADGTGSTDLQIETVLKTDPILAGRKVLSMPRYLPVDPKSPPKFLVFCDVINGQIDAYRGSPVKSPAVVEYLRGVAALPADRSKQLQYYFRFLDHSDPDIAADAYLEFAKTGDADVARAARQLDPAKLRKLISDSATPPERLSLFAYLLGASGGPADARFLADLLNDPVERLKPAFGGALAGLVQLQPKTGWARAREILADAKRPFAQRLAALGALRFFHASQPESSRAEVLHGLAAVLPQNDLGDLAIEDLRRWQWWDLTADVLGLYSRPTHAAPIMKRAILRYALCCPEPAAKQFVERVRSADGELVKDVEEGLRYERPASK